MLVTVIVISCFFATKYKGVLTTFLSPKIQISLGLFNMGQCDWYSLVIFVYKNNNKCEVMTLF